MRRTVFPRVLGSALLLILWSSASLATEPLFDRIEIEGQSGRLHDNARGWLDLPESEQLLSMARAENCTAIGGPRGKFKVADRTLFLYGLYRCSGDVALSVVYPKVSQPVVATWVTGKLTAEVGKVVCRSNAGAPVFERIATLSVEAGKVTSVSFSVPPIEQCGHNVS